MLATALTAITSVNTVYVYLDDTAALSVMYNMYLNKCLETVYAELKIINIKVTEIIKYIESNISKKRIINIL